jgi:hypothetical protein
VLNRGRAYSLPSGLTCVLCSVFLPAQAPTRPDDVLVFYKFLNLTLNSSRSPESTLERGGARNVSCEMRESSDEVAWFTSVKS